MTSKPGPLRPAGSVGGRGYPASPAALCSACAPYRRTRRHQSRRSRALAAIFSEQLHDDYKERKFTVAGPGVVLMTGRVLIKATSKGARADNDLNILAGWQEEKAAGVSSPTILKNPPRARAAK